MKERANKWEWFSTNADLIIRCLVRFQVHPQPDNRVIYICYNIPADTMNALLLSPFLPRSNSHASALFLLLEFFYFFNQLLLSIKMAWGSETVLLDLFFFHPLLFPSSCFFTAIYCYYYYYYYYSFIVTACLSIFYLVGILELSFFIRTFIKIIMKQLNGINKFPLLPNSSSSSSTTKQF